MEKILLVLDLDETLVYATDEDGEIRRLEEVRPADQVISSRRRRKAYPDIHVWERPHVREFLEKAREWFDLAVWTNGTDVYADKIVEWLFPRRDELQFVWGRSRSTYLRRIWEADADHANLVKPLKKILKKGYRKERVLAIDDTPYKWARSYSNHIAVRGFSGDRGDSELQDLLRYLDWIRNEEDVRPIEKRRWREHPSVRPVPPGKTTGGVDALTHGTRLSATGLSFLYLDRHGARDLRLEGLPPGEGKYIRLWSHLTPRDHVVFSSFGFMSFHKQILKVFCEAEGIRLRRGGDRPVPNDLEWKVGGGRWRYDRGERLLELWDGSGAYGISALGQEQLAVIRSLPWLDGHKVIFS